MNSDLTTVGIGYTLATGKLFCDWELFCLYCENLLGRSLWTHEFGTAELWQELRERFEQEVLENA